MAEKISLITICFNNLKELINTCNSVDEQTIKPFEHLIINGSTTDDIKNYFEQQQQPAYRKIISEKDKGIADAFNKGVKYAQGNIINMLNSGDVFFDSDSFQKVINIFKHNQTIKWLHAKYEILRGEKLVIIGKPFEKKKLYRGMRSICHQTMFVKKELFEKHGGFNTSLKFGMDYDFLIRIKDEPFYFLNEPIIIYDTGGNSSVKYVEATQEQTQIYSSYFKNSLLQKLWVARLLTLHKIMKSSAGKFLYSVKVLLKLENI